MHKSTKKRLENNNATDTNREETLYCRGLYSGYSCGHEAAWTGRFTAGHALAIIAIWAVAYLALGLGLLPFNKVSFAALALLVSAPALIAAFSLFRPLPGSGPWPANRMAAVTLAMMTIDFWIWIYNRPFEGLTANILLLVDIAAFTAIISCVYLFIYQRLHIDTLVKALGFKAFFDFAAYVLTGGFGISLIERAGLTHPLHTDAIFTVAMLELWALLVYIIKFRNKIYTLPD